MANTEDVGGTDGEADDGTIDIEETVNRKIKMSPTWFFSLMIGILSVGGLSFGTYYSISKSISSVERKADGLITSAKNISDDFKVLDKKVNELDKRVYFLEKTKD